MASTQQEHTRPYNQIPPQDDGNRIVISGMSGLYPQSRNVKEFSEILYNKVNPVTQEDIRFKYNHPEVVQYVGSIPELNYFDAQFFKVHYRLGNTMDPMARKVIEQAYQAIYDAGVNPEELSGKKVGVYIGSCFSEADKACFYEAFSRSGLGIAGCNKSMFANRISYWLNAKGPSMAIDQACCSSTAALEQAYLALSRGECEAAIVGGTYLCLHPQSSVHYGRCIKLCHDGKTKSFDERADGCAKSEAINVLFLQKAKDAMRIYAEILGAKTEFTCLLKEETGPKYGFYRYLNSITNFIENFYQDVRVSPQAIEYVEAFGCGFSEVDNIELQAIEKVFCKNRDDPLLIGSVMSNIGYGEAASGISAITKVLLGYHNGQLAANLHCEQPRRDIAALCDGRMRVVSEHQQFDRSYVAVNGMSVTGVNSHVLLHGCYKPKNLNRYTTSLPYLVTVSGRHEEAVKYMLKVLKSNPIDPEQLALLHNIHRMSISGHMSRGFIILRKLCQCFFVFIRAPDEEDPISVDLKLAFWGPAPPYQELVSLNFVKPVNCWAWLVRQSASENKHAGTDEEQIVSLYEKADFFDDARRPLWFVYSGMGSQWAGMGKQLMRIPIFAAAIERCGQALEPKGLDIVNIITSDDESIFDNILNSFVGIAAIQIGLTDVLHELGFKPDGIIGHSVGELGCAYADGCLTAEEMILSAYYRGLVSIETEFIQGSMAAVGMGYEQVSDICPPEIVVACHNGPQSSTLSGPSEMMREFVAELTAKGIFAKEVPCSNIAYHSRYIADAGPELLKYLKDTIRTPKARSERWLSTSVPQEKWNEPIAKLCSAEYLTNNLLNLVLFEETSRQVPNDAVLIEIAPHGLLQAILKRSMPATCKNIPLTKRKHPDNTVLFLEAIGKLYMQGYNTNLQVLYPKVEMPVSTGTPFLSHFVKWAHGEKWPMPLYRSASRKVAANCYLTLALHDKEHKYLGGNSIRGNTLYPFAASLTLVWDLLAMLLNMPKKQLSVEFSNLQLYSQPILHDRRQLQLSVTIQRGTGYFEVLDVNSKVATGFIFPELENKVKYIMDEQNKNMHYNTNEIYQWLRGRDYFYSGEFQSISRVDESFKDAELMWRDNWVTFIDSMLQLNVLRESHHAVSQPTRIRRIVIDVKAHSNAILKSRKADSKTLIRAKVSEKYDNTRCGGVLIENIKFEQLPPYSEPEMVLKSLTFVPYYSSEFEISSSLEVYSQIVAENLNKNTLTVVGIQNQPEEGSVFKEINDIIKKIFRIKINYKQITRKKAMKKYKFENVDLIVLANLSTDMEICQHFKEILPRDKFIVSEEYESLPSSLRHSSMYRVLSVHTNDQTKLHLVRWGSIRALAATTTVSVNKKTDLDFLSSVHANLTTGHRLLVLTCYPIPTGLKELISSWQNETIRNKVHLVTINDCYNSDLDEKFREMNLAFNTVTNGKWGGEYYLSMNKRPIASQNMTLQGAQFGDYESLEWVNIPPLTGSGVTVNVHYAGINKNDLKQADGSLLFKKNINLNYGMDFSGITESGKPVMGIVRNGAASTRVKALPELLWPVPAHWSLEDAATVPLAYVQAFYCLRIKIGLKQGVTVFVHGAAGALGQAIISIALAQSCEIFATVSDIRKKRFLLKMFPALKADHIGCSRDHTFTDMVETVSKGKKCDVVISSAKGKLKDITFNCITYGGQFLDISQLENGEEYNLGMAHLKMYKQYISVDFSSIFEPENKNDLETIHKMVNEGIARGCVRPLSRVTYGPHEVARAFRLLATSSHRGRVLVHMKGNTIHAQNRIRCSANRSQLILCGKTSYGLQFADRLVTRGAKQLHLHVPTQSSYLQHKIRCWQKLDINIVVSLEPLDSHEAVVSLIISSLQLGPLEGVYIIAEETDTDHNLISNLDVEIRKICFDLSYFSVIYFGDNSTGKNVCLNRLKDQLPATVLSLPEIKEELYSSFINWRGAVDAAEHALQNTHGVILAHGNKHRLSFLQQIANLAGLSIPDDVPRSVTLAELGIQNHKLQSLCTFLRVQYNLAFDEEQVRSLTINTILETERKVIALPCEDIRGLYTFFSYIDADELLATTEIVFLPTHVSSASMRDDEFEANQTNLCIIPGMEGHHERFRVFCERLKLPALVLQPGLDHPHETVVETAQRFVEILLKKTGMKDTFYLLGYESGIVVALEMAAILEDLGLTGKVFCVGCAPEEFVNELEEQLSAFEDEEQLQDGVLRHMYTLMTGEDCTALEHALRNSTTWSVKLDVCIRTLLGRVSHSAQYARSLIEWALTRLNQKQHYRVTPRPLRSQVILLRAALGHAPPQLTTLQDISEQPFVVYQLTSPMAHIMTDLRCATIINEHLDPKILESFASRNICDTYLLNANSFMSLEYDF